MPNGKKHGFSIIECRCAFDAKKIKDHLNKFVDHHGDPITEDGINSLVHNLKSADLGESLLVLARK